MKKTLTAFATAAVLATTAAPGAFAMEAETNALVGKVYNSLNNMQMDLAMIEDLTIKDVRQIQQIMSSGESESEKRNRINQILRTAGN